MLNITVLGAGGFGLALAIIMNKQGHNVTVWSKLENEIIQLEKDREHKQKLPGVKIPESIKLTTEYDAIKTSDMIIFGVPSSFVRSTAKEVSAYIAKDTIVLNAGKGLEDGTFKTLSEILEEEIPQAKIAVLSGPSHAEEVAREVPTAVVIASKSKETAEFIQKECSSSVLRMYVNTDVLGCELGGALKNIIALCAGICDGLGYGDNTKAAVMTRGMHEIVKLGLAMGGKSETFGGLTGMGDLIVTCTSMHSRNRRAGILIGKGVSPDEAVKQVGTVEGYFCCKAAYHLAKEKNVSMPITEELYNILYNGADVKQSLNKLMSRPFRSECDFWNK
ncbi:MAG: NAD(P)H-dependent glycerol-3-phosphate dehydrogenase [Oscillospiraceae bacterium]|nr:NAD(P)H-dependent glycerol-3-phosphate dehydrogenase [Oscillospiraceae bacterium]